MSTELEKQMRDGLRPHSMLKFKTDVSLEDFGKMLGHYNTLVKILTGKDATYQEFTSWLEREGYVDSEIKPTLEELAKGTPFDGLFKGNDIR
jgi:hypothetical protein